MKMKRTVVGCVDEAGRHDGTEPTAQVVVTQLAVARSVIVPKHNYLYSSFADNAAVPGYC